MAAKREQLRVILFLNENVKLDFIYEELYIIFKHSRMCFRLVKKWLKSVLALYLHLFRL